MRCNPSAPRFQPRFAGRTLLALTGALLALPGCGFEPGNAELAWKLAPASEQALADAPKEREALARELARLFGTPAAPRFGLPVQDGAQTFDPEHPFKPAAEGVRAEIGEPRLAQIQRDNQRRFARELAALAAGEYDAGVRFDSAPDLTLAWRAIAREQGLDAAGMSHAGRRLLGTWYPSLRDSSELYRQQCLHCHGVEGGGDGPTAVTLDPRPRDYRKGIFKFTAVKDKSRPRREDLVHLLDVGVYGTSMASFARLSEAEREGLADYVRLLAIRGEVEGLLVAGHAEDEAIDAESAERAYATIWKKWLKAREMFVSYDGEVPADTAQMRARGRELYLDTKQGNCVSCHGEQGLGDGVAVWKIDAKGRRVPAYQDDWGFDIVPRNLRTGVFRGGDRPIDVYRRIYAGINGGPMPGLGDSRDAAGQPLLSTQDLWALVHYVRSLSERVGEPPASGGGGH